MKFLADNKLKILFENSESTPRLCQKKKKKIENLQHQVEIRQQALHFTVIYEDDFMKRMGKRQLEVVRDEILDFIIDLRLQINLLKKNLKLDDNE